MLALPGRRFEVFGLGEASERSGAGDADAGRSSLKNEARKPLLAFVASFFKDGKPSGGTAPFRGVVDAFSRASSGPCFRGVNVCDFRGERRPSSRGDGPDVTRRGGLSLSSLLLMFDAAPGSSILTVTSPRWLI